MNQPPKERGKPYPLPVQATRIRFDPKGQNIAVAGIDGIVRILQSPELKLEKELKSHQGWVTALAYLPSGELLSADSWGQFCCWSESQLRWSHTAHQNGIRAIAVSPDGKDCATCSRDGLIRIAKTRTGEKLRERIIGVDLFSITYSPDGQTLAIGDLFGTIRILDQQLKTVREFRQPEFHLLDRIQDVGGIRCLLYSHDGKTLYAAGSQPKTGGFVQGFPRLAALDPLTGAVRWVWKGASESEGFIHDLCLLPNDRIAAVTSGQPGNGKLLIWSPPDANPIFQSTKIPNCHSLDLDPKGQILAMIGTNANSSGNGRVKGKTGEYPANHSPLQLWDIG